MAHVSGDSLPNELFGTDNQDLVEGLGGNDTLYAFGLNDTLIGGSGDDLLVGGAGADHLLGGDGADMASYVSAPSGVIINLAVPGGGLSDEIGDLFDGIENLQGSFYSDFLTGDAGANLLEGGAENDALSGGGGDDTLNGQDGDDTLTGGGGADSLNGEGGLDSAMFTASAAAVTISLLQAGPQASTGDASGDILVSIENLFGSDHGDSLVGDDFRNLLDGRGGNDTLVGNGDSDILRGGAGQDSLIGGPGFDVASYDDFNATQGVSVGLQVTGPQTSGGFASGYVLSGIERLEGSSHADSLAGTGGDDQLYGRGGNDTLTGAGSSDVLSGGTGADRILGGDGFDWAYYDGSVAGVAIDLRIGGPQGGGGEGAGDVLSGIDALRGSSFDDTLAGNGGANHLIGGGGRDRLFGMEGDDTISLGARSGDIATGGSGKDRFEIFYGTIDGPPQSADRIVDFQPGAGGDILDVAPILELLRPNDGFSGIPYLDPAQQILRLRSGSGGTELQLHTYSIGGGMNGNPQTGWYTWVVLPGVQPSQLVSENFFPLVAVPVVSGPPTDSPSGPSTSTIPGADSEPEPTPDPPAHPWDGLAPGVGPSTVVGGMIFSSPGGDRALQGGASADSIRGSGGLDTISGDDGEDLLFGEGGSDSINGNRGDDELFGGDGADTVMGGKGNDWLHGEFGSDWLNGNLDNDILMGGAGNDTLYGGQGTDSLSGGAADDLLSGDLANDILAGGAGADRFAYATGGGNDRIEDFEPGFDRILIHLDPDSTVNGVIILAVGDLLALVDDTGDGAYLRLGDGQGLLLAGRAKSELSPDDFLLL